MPGGAFRILGGFKDSRILQRRDYVYPPEDPHLLKLVTLYGREKAEPCSVMSRLLVDVTVTSICVFFIEHSFQDPI